MGGMRPLRQEAWNAYGLKPPSEEEQESAAEDTLVDVDNIWVDADNRWVFLCHGNDGQGIAYPIYKQGHPLKPDDGWDIAYEPFDLAYEVRSLREANRATDIGNITSHYRDGYSVCGYDPDGVFISRKALGLVTLQHQLCHRRVEALSKLTEAQRRAQSPDEDSCTGSFRRQFGLVPTRLRRGSALPRSLQSETPTSIGGSARTLPLGTSISLSSSPSQLWYVVEDQLLDPSRSPLLPSHVETTIVDEPLRAANVIPLNGSLWTRRRSRDTSIKDGISKCRHRRRHEDVDGARGLGGLQEDGEEVADGDEASKIEYTRPKELQVQRLVQPYSSGGQNRTPPWLVDR
ncbi:predicted protein [Chaetomium globosum CBS 148.51]|uniref:Uncharacterized protein n=1 Tax=Chaetomium globosum (strain ATCC 6205 / CBS 148.51 / DSM 1962 / NBRC 6347 / NRRL 1970) TaxID=306901 RepID=Q2HC20_CHAGB|nr:uncharacterized protein CHGG_02234 [Chaetomium globosum CBS 148.51]EAQ90299.1 predicted protein [Chaetomium globosum CBS 148.51]